MICTSEGNSAVACLIPRLPSHETPSWLPRRAERFCVVDIISYALLPILRALCSYLCVTPLHYFPQARIHLCSNSFRTKEQIRACRAVPKRTLELVVHLRDRVVARERSSRLIILTLSPRTTRIRFSEQSVNSVTRFSRCCTHIYNCRADIVLRISPYAGGGALQIRRAAADKRRM